jgi:CTP synthase
MHLTLVPYIAAAGELKTKPTQHSVKELRSIGIQADILLCRAEREIPISERKKIALFCNIAEDNVIQALDVGSIYEVPLRYHAEGLDVQVLKHFGLEAEQSPDLSGWNDLLERRQHPQREVTVAIVGKYTGIGDAYKSLSEALDHAAMAHRVKVKQLWVDAKGFEKTDISRKLKGVDAILVPGGFGDRGIEGKLAAITFAREHKIPYFGICLGMQLAVIEMARNLAGLPKAYSSEFTDYEVSDKRGPLVGIMTEWVKGDTKEKRSEEGDLGGTMRLGAYDCKIAKGSLAEKIYGSTKISERHRHRYEVNTAYLEQLEKTGARFSGMSPDGQLPEIVERPDHPWFVAVQFHPEFKSRPFAPHPLFYGFVGAALEHASA